MSEQEKSTIDYLSSSCKASLLLLALAVYAGYVRRPTRPVLTSHVGLHDQIG